MTSLMQLGEKARALWCQTIPGEPCSKANSRRLVKIFGKPRSIKSAKALSYVAAARMHLQAHKPSEPFDGDLILDCFIWYASRRPDLDESLIMDVLQASSIIKNDRQIKEKHIYWRLDPGNPRALVTLSRAA